MENVNIKFNGKEFLLSCEDRQEDHLEELSNHLNNKFHELKSSLGNIGENKLLLITSITVMDEYFETKKKVEQKKKELNDLTEKFKELKSLVYDYRDNKEQQISKLNEDQINLKTEIEKNQADFENILDNTTSKIEDFVKKVSSESIQ